MTETKIWLLAGAALMTLAVPAHAQQDSDEGDADARGTTQLSLDKVVVSAGAEKVAIDTPQAVTVLDQEDIDQTQATTIGDLLEGVPGVNVQGGVGALGQGFNIRGMGTAIGDSDNRILITVDGVTKFYEQYRMGAFFSDPELYKRVEVLRGPASSTLYGAGALAGVLNFTTKDASDFLSGADRLAIRLKAATETNAEAHMLSGIVAVAPVAGLELLGSYNYRRAGEYESGNGTTVTSSNALSDSWLAKARYNFTSDRKHAIWASYQDWVSDAPQVYDQITGSGFDATLMRRRVHDKTAVIGYVNDFNGSKLFNVELTGSYALSNVHQTETMFLGNLAYSEFSYESWQGKLQNSSSFDLGSDINAHLIVGGQWSKQTRLNPRVSRTTGMVTPGAGTHPEGEMTRYGAFAQLEFSWSDKLMIIPGVRVDWTDLKPGATVVGGTVLTRRVRENGVSPKIAAIYSLTGWLGLFGSVSRTVRMPNIDETFTRSATRPNNPNLRPETSDNIEGGVTLSLDGLASQRDKFRLKATVFQNDVKDLILNAAGAVGTPYFTNVGRSRFSGVEVEAEYGVGGFFARGNASFLSGKDRLTGLYLNTIPANDYRLTLGYADRATGLSGGWTGEFAERQDKVNRTAFASAGAGIPTPGYNVHSLFFAFRPQGGSAEGFEFRIAADNIFNEQFRRHLSSLDAEGRTFKFTVAKTF